MTESNCACDLSERFSKPNCSQQAAICTNRKMSKLTELEFLLCGTSAQLPQRQHLVRDDNGLLIVGMGVDKRGITAVLTLTASYFSANGNFFIFKVLRSFNAFLNNN